MAKGMSDPTKGMMSLDVDIDVSAITEEAVETVFAGHDFFRGASSKSNPPPGSAYAGSKKGSTRSKDPSPDRDKLALILDIAKGTDSSWLMRLQAGAW